MEFPNIVETSDKPIVLSGTEQTSVRFHDIGDERFETSMTLQNILRNIR